MSKGLLLSFLAGGASFLLLTGTTPALEKVKFASPVRTIASLYLPILAAEEKGYWKANGLDVEWIPVGSTVALAHAITAGSVRVGVDGAVGMFMGIARGVPAIAIAEGNTLPAPSALWVRANSPAREAKDLRKGALVGVLSIGGFDHALGRMLLKALGMERDVRFVALGGAPQTMAALKAGAVDATAMVLALMIPLEVKGEVRAIARATDYIKELPYLGSIYWARRDFFRTNRETVVRTIKAVLQAQEFVNKNQRWAEEKMKSEQGVPERAAEELYKLVRFSEDGKITRDRLEKARNFLVEYDLVPRDKLPAIEDLYATEITG